MYSYDLNTGQLSQDSCPRVHESELSPVEIVNNANLMGCGYGQMGNPQYNPYGQYGGGYNPQAYNPYQQQYGGYNGYGMYFGTPQQQNYNPYNQGMYMNQPTSGFGTYQGNPAFQYMQNNNMYQQNQYQQRPATQDYTYWQPGHNTGSTTLFPSDIKEQCDKLQAQMMDELDEAYVKKTQNYNQYCKDMGYNPNTQNYYGMPYVQQQNYYDPGIINKYRGKVEDLRSEAVQRRTDLNKNLSRLCHNYLNDGVTDEMIDEMYDGHMVTIPGADIDSYYDQAKYSRMVEIDTSIWYKEHNRQVSQEMMSYFPKGQETNMYEFFENAGQILIDIALEEEAHRRRNVSGLVQPTTTYRAVIRACSVNRDGSSNDKGGNDNIYKAPDMNAMGGGYNYNSGISDAINFMSDESIPIEQRALRGIEEGKKVLEKYRQDMLNSGNYRLDENGNLELVIPEWFGKSTMDEDNEKENKYQEDLQRFKNAIYKRNTDMLSQVMGTNTKGSNESDLLKRANQIANNSSGSEANSLPSSGGGGNDIRSVIDDDTGTYSSLYGGVDEDGEYWVL